MRQHTVSDARRHRRLTQVELAKRAGISRATLCRLEAGQMLPRLTTVRRLEAALRLRLRFEAPEEAAQ